jgi:hypothetical protein
MALLAMNWRDGKPPSNFVGFAIEFREPDSNEFWAVRNRIGFFGQGKKFSDPPVPSTMAPLQKFRWVHFPNDPNKQGRFTYRVTPKFMDENGALSSGEPQTVSLALLRHAPGQINIAFTRGFVSRRPSSEVQPDGAITTLVLETRSRDSNSTHHKRADEAYQ